MFLHKTPSFIKFLYPGLLWKVEEQEKVIYLTFDDGPVPEVTPSVLSQLDDFGAKATFFCVGENVSRYPDLVKSILAQGHSIGNHTHNHLNGWRTRNDIYIKNIALCEKVLVETNANSVKKIFRPPYGRIKRGQVKLLKDFYKIVMWDVLSGDFDQRMKKENCLDKSIKYTESGSIIVFHDSIKASHNLHYCLPRYLSHFTKRGYTFRAIW